MFGRIAKAMTAPARIAAKAITGSGTAEGSFTGAGTPEGPMQNATLRAIKESSKKNKEDSKKFLSSFIFGRGRRERRDPVEDFKISR